MDPLTDREGKKYKCLTRCHICFKNFKEGDHKVRDHCHYTGRYRGSAHDICNLRYRIPSHIPIIAHNSAGYNIHLFIKELATHFNDIEVISKNKEDYISFSIKVPVDKYIDKEVEKDRFMELRFINSFAVYFF